MEWQLILLFIFGSLVILMLAGMPIAFCFLLINVVGMFVFFGTLGQEQLIVNMLGTLNTFILSPIPLFILMGDVMLHSGIAPDLIGAMDKWLGRLPGRLGLVSVIAGTVIAALTGTNLASVAMLGSVLTPEMEKQGYKKPISLGTIMGSGGLAMMIPPSALAVLCGAIGQISVSNILLGIIIPGLLMAVLYAAYIILRCWLQPSIAPPYDVRPVPLSEKLIGTAKYVLPQGLVIFLVIGVMVLGIATPTEAAATGCLGTVVLSFVYRRMNWQVAKKTTISTLSVTVMIFLILAGAQVFGQVMAYSGATAGLAELARGLPVAPVVVVIIMQVIVLFLGMFMDVVAIMMITLPIFVPIVIFLGLDPVWFAVAFLININIAGISPPFGLSLFVMKAVAPPDTTMADVYKAAIPFCILNIIAMAVVIALPVTALWLPGTSR